MEFFVENVARYGNGYGDGETRVKYKRPYELFKKEAIEASLQSGDSDMKHMCLVNTVLRRSWFKSTHFMALDCDSVDNMYAVGHAMKAYGIGYCLVESSPGHYWFFTDVIGPFKECIKKANGIIGVDRKYIQLCRDQKQFSIRAFPKCTIPELNRVTTTNQEIINWTTQYLDMYNQDFMKQVQTNLRMAQALKDGTMAALAADPTFDI